MDSNQYLIIGGSTKCGTTSVFNYFEYHPQVCPCIMKESRYFWMNTYPLTAASRQTKHVKDFRELFKNCLPGQMRMEATPDYLYSTETAERIHAELPQSKMLFILREPVSRLISWYKFSLLNGLIPRNTAINDYILSQKSLTGATVPQHLRALEQGRYSRYVEHYIHTFGKENTCLAYYEDLVKNPENFCRAISVYAGIDENYFNDFEFKIFNKTVAAKSVDAHRFFRKFKRTIRPVTRLFNPSIRKKLKLAGQHVEATYQSANANALRDEVQLSQEMLSFVSGYYASEKSQLERLTGSTPPW